MLFRLRTRNPLNPGNGTETNSMTNELQIESNESGYWWSYRCGEGEEVFNSPVEAVIDFIEQQSVFVDDVFKWKPEEIKVKESEEVNTDSILVPLSLEEIKALIAGGGSRLIRRHKASAISTLEDVLKQLHDDESINQEETK